MIYWLLVVCTDVRGPVCLPPTRFTDGNVCQVVAASYKSAAKEVYGVDNNVSTRCVKVTR